MTTKEALILVLELAGQAALDPDKKTDDPNLREIAEDQQAAIEKASGLLDSIDWKFWD